MLTIAPGTSMCSTSPLRLRSLNVMDFMSVSCSRVRVRLVGRLSGVVPPAVVVPAEHPAVGGDGPAPGVPGRDVVGLHLPEFVVFPAERADALLVLVGFALLAGGECPDAEIPLL